MLCQTSQARDTTTFARLSGWAFRPRVFVFVRLDEIFRSFADGVFVLSCLVGSGSLPRAILSG
jgi:hypothetical protein